MALQIYYLTDRELFGTIFLSKVTKRITTDKARKLLAELEGEIEVDDYVVHEDYGIGIYKGIKQEEFKQEINLGFGEKKQRTISEDYILIEYAEKDELYLPINQINKITKYINDNSEEPQITRLGRLEWKNITKRIKEDIKKIAGELINLYAKREITTIKGFDTADSPAYLEFCDAFPFEFTKDQKRAEKEITEDLAKSKPMNRLIVGDVGFGKTEVAIRASYKVCENGFQVAVLCPTTVLASQHEKIFTDRFKNTGFKVACLSRLSKHNHKKIVEDIALGKIDIVIGTHRLLSKDIEFKNLGLIVIDEEQKFGVKQKEKLKSIELKAHTLSMSATPIPRTLSMALSSIQDISLINTAPQNRKHIQTKVEKFNVNKVVESINYEIKRGGQVYYLHNEVKSIESVKEKLTRLMPNVSFVVAHGQLNAELLSQRINDFYDKKYDCLICTTIIENGIDMPNVNTIIIEGAERFGLGQLYQLRGRVGRSDRQAYCYLFYSGDDINKETELDSAKKLKDMNYKKRLKAILESQDLGSGFKLASRDLEIRGAGNLLGKAQHGNIKYMGYGLYMQLLAEEIEKLKHNK